MGTILLVCTGNICRSPMAEGFLRQLLQERGASTVTLSSAGVYSWDDSPATPEAVRALEERGIDISGHVARRLTRALVEEADLVLGMASDHCDAVARMVPAAADRTFTIKESRSSPYRIEGCNTFLFAVCVRFWDCRIGHEASAVIEIFPS